MAALDCDIAIIGGGLGGVAAALAACEAGMRVVLTEETDWPGGQISAQGVAALDEHEHIERFGGTASYYRLREGIRAYYRAEFNAPQTTPEGYHGENVPLNPGNAWVSRLSFLPEVGVRVIGKLLAPHIEAGRLRVLYEHSPIRAEVEDDNDGGRRIRSVTLADQQGAETTLRAAYFLDATDLGDLLPLTGTEYVTGAEAQSDTGEPHAPPDARPGEVQSFTWSFAVEYRPGEDHTIPRPPGYEAFRDTQPYSLTLTDKDGQPLHFRMFATGEGGRLPFWTYRRLHDSAQLGGRDVALINWHGNDYYGGSIVDVPPDERDRHLKEGRLLALGFLHWLQTECPRDEGGQGYPEFKLRPDVMATADGLAKRPYIREGRRLLARRRIVEGDIVAESQPGARARNCRDAVGLGWYAIDLHPCVGNPQASMFAPTRPFQIPLGALIPRVTVNLIAAGKCIGTTHLTNGAYRLHPVEWNTGEAAGALAAYCVTTGQLPREVHDDERRLWRLQYQLARRGVPLAWALDIPQSEPLFIPSQLLLVRDVLSPQGTQFRRLEIHPDEALSPGSLNRDVLMEAVRLLGGAVEGWPPGVLTARTWRNLCAILNPVLQKGLE
jgi:hypothetical protein